MMPLVVVAGMQRRWFEAGEYLLAIDTVSCSDDIPHLRDAVLLDEHADLLHVVAMILGNEQHWAPVEDDTLSVHRSAMLTHTVSRTGASNHQVGLKVPVCCSESVNSVAASLADIVQIRAHCQPVVVEFDICSLDASDKMTLQAPGALLLLGEVMAPGKTGTICAGDLQFPARYNDAQSAMQVLALEQDHLGQENYPTSESNAARQSSNDRHGGKHPNQNLTDGVKASVRWPVDHTLHDIRTFSSEDSVPIAFTLHEGTQVELALNDGSSPTVFIPGVIVRMGASFALRTEAGNDPAN